MGRVVTGLLLFLKLFGRWAAGEHAVFDRPGGVLPDLPEVFVQWSFEIILIDWLQALEQFRFVIRAFRRLKRGIQSKGKEEGETEMSFPESVHGHGSILSSRS